MDGKTGLEKGLQNEFDLIVLDLMLPEMDGLEVCKELRQNKILTPILMLTAKDDEFDKVLGLELGADDYLTKPFSPREVVLRVKALLRRSSTSSNLKTDNVTKDILEFPHLMIDNDAHRC